MGAIFCLSNDNYSDINLSYLCENEACLTQMKPVHPEKHRNASNTNNLQLREDYYTGQ